MATLNRHLASLRSICETFGGKPAYCTCGKQASDSIHFSSTEYDTLSRSGLIIEHWGQYVEAQILPDGELIPKSR